MTKVNSPQQCCCGCGCSCETNKKEVTIDYLYLDLNTCDRCIGTDTVLEEVMNQLSPALELAGYSISYNKIEILSKELAIKHRFLSSPTIRVNGKDICDEVNESDCGCCGEISGSQVDCRVFVYEGKSYEVPPKEMLAEAILKNAFASTEDNSIIQYVLPQNLKNFLKVALREQIISLKPVRKNSLLPVMTI